MADEKYQCPACNNTACRRNVVNIQPSSHRSPIYVHAETVDFSHDPSELDVFDTWADEGGSIPPDSEE